MLAKHITILFLFAFFLFSVCESAGAKLVIHSKTAVKIELTGYKGLVENSLFKGALDAGGVHEIHTPYRGLALLVFPEGQRYPVIIGDQSFTLKIAEPNKAPLFTGSGENDFFYRLLAGGAPDHKQYKFALLMFRAKKLLESTISIKSITELTEKKKEFHYFVSEHYQDLEHSDMLRRLMAGYFMMHEYADYHTKEEPATSIKIKYQEEVLDGIESWLEILKPHLTEQEIINYIVSLYYNRSMVTLASLVIDKFREIAYCPGEERETFNFPADLLITGADGGRKKTMADFTADKIIAFVSEDCPVSMVETVRKARYPAGRKKVPMLVAPLQKLSGKHLSMAGMLSNGNMFFINDEEWRTNNLPKKIRLPLFVRIGESD